MLKESKTLWLGSDQKKKKGSTPFSHVQDLLSITLNDLVYFKMTYNDLREYKGIKLIKEVKV